MADMLNNRIQKFDPNGNLLTQWGSLGSGSGQFMNPFSIAVGGSPAGSSLEYLFVVDTGNNRVQRFLTDGTYQGSFGGPGSGLYQLKGPRGVGVGHDATRGWAVWVTDTYNHRIVEFTITGLPVTQFGSFGSGDGQFKFPHGNIGIKYSGFPSLTYLFLVTDMNNRVQIFYPSGLFGGSLGSTGSALRQFNDPFGANAGSTFFIADAGNNRIQEFDGFVNASDWTTLVPAGASPATFASGSALGIATNNQFIYVSDPGNHRIVKFAY
jgi:hypothetical protein